MGNLTIEQYEAIYSESGREVDDGLASGIGSTGKFVMLAAAVVTPTASTPGPTQGSGLGSPDLSSFSSGLMDGFNAGFDNTVDFFLSLKTSSGWRDAGFGLMQMAILASNTPAGMINRNEISRSVYNYVQNIPNMSSYEMGFDIGYGAEKTLEMAVLKGVYSSSGVGIGNVRILSNTTPIGTTLFKTGKNFRIDIDTKNGLHYHRRGPGGIKRHRPWEVKPGDKGDIRKRF
ncbi:hypothetical protein GC167_00855 [bacterium]|nr:hypothetical protein [bacterium]